MDLICESHISSFSLSDLCIVIAARTGGECIFVHCIQLGEMNDQAHGCSSDDIFIQHYSYDTEFFFACCYHLIFNHTSGNV